MTFQIDFGNLAVGVGTVTLAYVTFLISSKTLTQSKNQKVAEFRIHWVEALRIDVATFIALATIRERTPAQLEKMHEIQARIMLRLNRKEKEHLRMRDELLLLIDCMHGKGDKKAIEQASVVTKAFQDLFNFEWGRIKSEIKSTNLVNEEI